jgi:hypothetical protein
MSGKCHCHFIMLSPQSRLNCGRGTIPQRRNEIKGGKKQGNYSGSSPCRQEFFSEKQKHIFLFFYKRSEPHEDI